MALDFDKVRELILHVRAYDAKDEVLDGSGDPESGEDADLMRTNADDPDRAVMAQLIAALDEDAQAELVALFWVGRGDFYAEEFEDAAREAKRSKTTPTEDYLLGAPLLGDHLEAGIDAMDREEDA